MIDLYKEAKNRLKAKKMGKDSKLHYNDIRDLIILAMVDGILTKKEILELKEIKRYSYENMNSDAEVLYSRFMAGALGEKGHIIDSTVDIIGKAEGMLAAKSIKSEPLIFTTDDIRDILILSIRDGRLTAEKVDQLIKVKDILNNRITTEGADLYLKFAAAYHKRLYPDQPKQTQQATHQPRQTVQQTTNYNQKTQCGSCYGSGTVTCSSCYGMGGRNESRTDYDYDGSAIYRTEFVQCYGCNGGYSKCGMCGGTGQVYV